MKFLVNADVQSFSDVITNSSSEIYIVNPANGGQNGALEEAIDYITTTCDNFFKTNTIGTYELREIIKARLNLVGKDEAFFTNETWRRFYSEMIEYERDNLIESTGGMGGDIEVSSLYKNYETYVDICEGKIDPGRLWMYTCAKKGDKPLPFKDWFDAEYGYAQINLSDDDLNNAKNLLLVDIDRCRYASINFLENVLKAKRID